MRFAGTWIRYSKSAMPHDTSAATIHGLPRRSRRCAYQAKVMKTFEQTSRSAVRPIRFIRPGIPGGVAMGNGRLLPQVLRVTLLARFAIQEESHADRPRLDARTLLAGHARRRSRQALPRDDELVRAGARLALR